ncbi:MULTISPECIES: hypothetical protein [Streptomyces]|uniref:hypothetical protein n=1 Tax=Streptomyces TaxID=1883 RepID=UPI002F93B354
MGNRFASAAACLALAIAGLTAAAGTAAADEQGTGTVRAAEQDGAADGAGTQQPVPDEVAELICRLQANLPNVPGLPNLPNLPALPNGPHPVPLPHCLVNGWQ